MYSSKDFLEMLQEGKNVDDIARELTSALNEAVAQKTEMEEKKKKAAAATKDKVDCMAKLLNESMTFFNKYYPKFYDLLFSSDFDSEEMAAVVVASLDDIYKDVEPTIDILFRQLEKSEKKYDAIEKFLKDYNL